MIYTYNPACHCVVCQNNGEIPFPHAGELLGYAEPHIPPAAPAGPKIIALISWYDEPADWLKRCIHSLAHLHVNHVIALDGAYQHYPNPQARSDQAQHEAIKRASDDIRTPLTIRAPAEPWTTELDKRNHLFALAEALTEPDDWYLVIDADEYITAAPTNIRARLAETPFDVAAVTLLEPGHPLGTIVYPTHPKLFRAIPGLRTVRDHFTYTTPDGRKLWGDAKRARLEPRLDLTAITVEHHNQLRHRDRRQAALAYYRTRDALGLEDLPANRTLLKDAA